MKRSINSILVLAGAAMLLAGCAKEIEGTRDGGDNVFTFTVGIPDTATKAVADGDGAAAKINHWVMEVRDSDGAVYSYQEKDGAEGVTTQTFDIALIKGQTYNVLFWADTKGTYNVADLTNVKFVDADASGYAANLDSRDAFSAAVAGFSTTTATQQSVTLKRPFAQLNVIFTDLDTLQKQLVSNDEYLKFEPVDFEVLAKVPTTFNVQTQTAGDPAATALTVTAGSCYLDNYASHGAEETLFMDYFFATAGSKDVVDIDFSFVSKGVSIAHSFTSVPFQRNYRTNIKGNLMTANARWNVTVDPTWYTPDYDVPYLETSSIAEAQAYIAPDTQGSQEAKVVKIAEGSVTASDVKTDKVENLNVVEFVLKTTSPKEVSFQLPAVGDNADAWYVTHEDGYPTGNVSVSAPEGTKVIIDAPNSHVEVTGTSYAQIIASTNTNTLVIPAGCTVDNLIVKEGGLEIHGTVNNVTIDVAQGKQVLVRSCENLSQSVYDVLKAYIADGYKASQNSDQTWNIVLAAKWINYAASSFSQENGKTITIMSAEELALLAKNVNEGNKYNGYTFELGVDIDLSDREWTPMTSFAGTFDGKDHFIKAMTITEGSGNLGLFAALDGAKIQNLTVKNASITGSTMTGAYIGVIAGSFGVSKANNVHVVSAAVTTTAQYVGGIAGSSSGTIESSSVENCAITGKDQIGAMVGYQWCNGIWDCTATNNAVEATEERAGGLVGKFQAAKGNDSFFKMSNNVVSGCATAPDMAGGLAGQIMGDMSNYEIKDNTIDVSLSAPKTSPIGVLRADQDSTFTSVLAANITGNSWTERTLDADSYTYTDAETGAGDQVILNDITE